MGYYTYFGLTILDEKGKEIVGNEIIKKIRENCEAASCAFGEAGDAEDACKWHSWNDDFIKLSKMFPKNILQVHGDGEESDDCWIAYFMDGKTQHCPGEMTYPPLDLNLIYTNKFKPRTLKNKN